MSDEIKIPEFDEYHKHDSNCPHEGYCGVELRAYALKAARWMREKIAKEFEGRASGFWSAGDIAERVRKLGGVK